jgi:hypothetical protein
VASKSLVEWLKMLWENWGMYAWRVVRYLLSPVLCLCPLRRGSSPSFYRPRKGRITCMPHYSATWGSMVRRAVE